MMRRFFLFCILSAIILPGGFSQKLKKADKTTLSSLETEIGFLAGDPLEGRLTGSNGEKLASDYISASFAKSGLTPRGDQGGWLQTFQVYDGRQVREAHFVLNGIELELSQDYFPLPFSGNQKVEGSPAIALQESGQPWFIDLREQLESNQHNPHFDLGELLHEKVRESSKRGATAVIFFNTSRIADNLVFDAGDRSPVEALPVFYVTTRGRRKYLRDESLSLDLKLQADIKDRTRWGHNVVGYLDNHASYTVIIGAHYDHLGYGEDGNSLYRGTEKMIHHGADDNASGTAALMELAKMLSESKRIKNNYLFVAFSGEELGLLGSHYFADHLPVEQSRISYMMNMDMIGRLNDSTHLLTIGGYGTSPQWGPLLADNPYKNFFSLRFDSSGTGPSDHTSFYLKNIPVLFFFTGIHRDYHRPTDAADKINYLGELEIVKYIYSLAEKMDGRNKPAFAKTSESPAVAYSRFNVTLGIMPDYTFSGSGVRIDGISEGRPAVKAGLQSGDVIIRLGDYPVSSLETYMRALSKFKKGDTTTVKFQRVSETIQAAVQFD
jgi:aminopeptidase YwaD